ncbi:hypothetical protein Bca4012_026563 [Brassica carinata]
MPSYFSYLVKEEQRVIEAKIRIRQKEVEEEEEERMQKRLNSPSSSRISDVRADTEYGSAAGRHESQDSRKQRLMI